METTRWCNACNKEKSVQEFHPHPYGKRNQCRLCINKKGRDRAKALRLSGTVLCPTCRGPKSTTGSECRSCSLIRIRNLPPVWKKDKHGYMTCVRAGKEIAQHRYVMEQHLGRSLLPGETVHHKNGVRGNNRIENLELWVSWQPSGQRPEDLLEWADEIIKRYRK